MAAPAGNTSIELHLWLARAGQPPTDISAHHCAACCLIATKCMPPHLSAFAGPTPHARGMYILLAAHSAQSPLHRPMMVLHIDVDPHLPTWWSMWTTTSQHRSSALTTSTALAVQRAVTDNDPMRKIMTTGLAQALACGSAIQAAPKHGTLGHHESLMAHQGSWTPSAFLVWLGWCFVWCGWLLYWSEGFLRLLVELLI